MSIAAKLQPKLKDLAQRTQSSQRKLKNKFGNLAPLALLARAISENFGVKEIRKGLIPQKISVHSLHSLNGWSVRQVVSACIGLNGLNPPAGLRINSAQ
jgi:hypothetical protein